VKVEERALTNQNAATWLARGREAIAAGDAQVDLSDVQAVDSAAVALLLDWQRAAQARGAALSLIGVPAGIESLARLYGVTALLGLREPAGT
jgi:phospholipid transport system transporter-binding protein